MGITVTTPAMADTTEEGTRFCEWYQPGLTKTGVAINPLLGLAPDDGGSMMTIEGYPVVLKEPSPGTCALHIGLSPTSRFTVVSSSETQAPTPGDTQQACLRAVDLARFAVRRLPG